MNKHREIDSKVLSDWAWEYIEECLENVIEVPTVKGILDKKERHIPTIDYFLNIWLRLNGKDKPYTRQHWYKVKADCEHPLCDTIKEIDALFSSLAADIVANEGKGIFYAKNKLGWTDKVDTKETGTKTVNLTIENINSPVPVANSERDIID